MPLQEAQDYGIIGTASSDDPRAGLVEMANLGYK